MQVPSGKLDSAAPALAGRLQLALGLLECLELLSKFQAARFSRFLTRCTDGLNAIPNRLPHLGPTLRGKEHYQRRRKRSANKRSRRDPEEPIHHITSIY